MKTNIYSIAAATIAGALCLSLGSCSDSAELGDGKYTVSLKPHKLSIESTGSTYLKSQTDDDGNFSGYTFECPTGGWQVTYGFKITAEETPWAFKGIPNWIKISPSTGSSSQNIEMVVEANTPTKTERTASITLESTDPEWEYSIPINMTQAAMSPVLYKETQFGNFSSEGETYDCTFSANFTPSIAYEGNDGNWITATIEENGKEYNHLPGYTLNVTTKPNEETTRRTGYVLLQYKGNTIGNCEVCQYGFTPYVSSISKTTLYMDKNGGTSTITYKANFKPTIQCEYMTDWGEASIDTDNSTITVTVQPYSGNGSRRLGYLYMMYKNKKIQTIDIYQYGY